MNESDLPTRGRHGTKRDCETSAYKGIYCVRREGASERCLLKHNRDEERIE